MPATMSTTTNATAGMTSASREVPTAPPSSAVARMGLPKPAVKSVVPPRMVAIATWITPAIPPPAMKARDHVIKGLMSVNIEALTMAPATTAAGAGRS